MGDKHGSVTGFISHAQLGSMRMQKMIVAPDVPKRASCNIMSPIPCLQPCWQPCPCSPDNVYTLTPFSHHASSCDLLLGPLLGTEAVQQPPWVFLGSSHLGSMCSLNR